MKTSKQWALEFLSYAEDSHLDRAAEAVEAVRAEAVQAFAAEVSAKFQEVADNAAYYKQTPTLDAIQLANRIVESLARPAQAILPSDDTSKIAINPLLEPHCVVETFSQLFARVAADPRLHPGDVSPLTIRVPGGSCCDLASRGHRDGCPGQIPPTSTVRMKADIGVCCDCGRDVSKLQSQDRCMCGRQVGEPQAPARDKIADKYQEHRDSVAVAYLRSVESQAPAAPHVVCACDKVLSPDVPCDKCGASFTVQAPAACKHEHKDELGCPDCGELFACKHSHATRLATGDLGCMHCGVRL